MEARENKDACPTGWRIEKEGKRWVPDFSGMTYGGAGMTYGGAGMTYVKNEIAAHRKRYSQ